MRAGEVLRCQRAIERGRRVAGDILAGDWSDRPTDVHADPISSDLLLKNREGQLSEQERAELDVLARQFDAATLAKGRALGLLAQFDRLPLPGVRAPLGTTLWSRARIPDCRYAPVAEEAHLQCGYCRCPQRVLRENNLCNTTWDGLAIRPTNSFNLFLRGRYAA